MTMTRQIEIKEARVAMALKDAADACRDLAGPHLAPAEDAWVWHDLARELEKKVDGLLTPGWRGLSQPHPGRS